MADSKRGRKPIGKKTMTAAERQAERRSRLRNMVQDAPAEEWTEAACLFVLSTKEMRHTDLEQEAWAQLGRLRDLGDDEELPDDEPTPEETLVRTDSLSMRYAEIGISQLERIEDKDLEAEAAICKVISWAIDRLGGMRKEKKLPREKQQAFGAEQYAIMALTDLDKIKDNDREAREALLRVMKWATGKMGELSKK